MNEELYDFGQNFWGDTKRTYLTKGPTDRVDRRTTNSYLIACQKKCYGAREDVITARCHSLDYHHNPSGEGEAGILVCMSDYNVQHHEIIGHPAGDLVVPLCRRIQQPQQDISRPSVRYRYRSHLLPTVQRNITTLCTSGYSL